MWRKNDIDAYAKGICDSNVLCLVRAALDEIIYNINILKYILEAGDRPLRENADVKVFSEMPMQTTQSMETPQPPIGTRSRTVGPSLGVACIWIVYTRQGSVAVLQVTGSLLLQILLCYLIVVSVRSC